MDTSGGWRFLRLICFLILVDQNYTLNIFNCNSTTISRRQPQEPITTDQICGLLPWGIHAKTFLSGEKQPALPSSWKTSRSSISKTTRHKTATQIQLCHSQFRLLNSAHIVLLFQLLAFMGAFSGRSSASKSISKGSCPMAWFLGQKRL